MLICVFDPVSDSRYSAKIASNYAGLVSLSIRQAFAATELTVSKTSTGAFNTSDVLLFMKGTSSSALRL